MSEIQHDEQQGAQPQQQLAISKAAAAIRFDRRGIVISSMEELWRFAVCVWRAGMVPKSFKNVESVVAAMQYGMELGIPPMSSLRTIAVINGTPKLWGDGMLGVCTRSPVFDHSSFKEWIAGEGQDAVAFCTVRRLPNGLPVTRSFSISDAKCAGLVGKEGPWQTYPLRMLQMRARAFALRDTFPDLLFGADIADDACLGEMQEVEVEDADRPLVSRVESLYQDDGERDAQQA